MASVNLNSTLKNRNASYRIGDGGSSGNTLLLPAASIFLVAVIACFLERPQHQRLALEARKKA